MSARRLWAEYFGSADGIVYIVDAADTIRFEEAKNELAQLLECEELQVREQQLRFVPHGDRNLTLLSVHHWTERAVLDPWQQN